MQDLEIAKKQLYDKQLTLVIVKNGQVFFQTDSHRISGFIGAIEKFDTDLNGASVADRVAGKALALLCVYAGIREVYAEVLSRKAKAVFEENKLAFEWKQLVDNVLDLNKTDTCPFEKAAADISDPKDSYVAFKALLEKMKPCK
jgi:predicted RNA methylase